MTNYKLSKTEKELFAVLNALKTEENDADVVFAVALSCMGNEAVQQKIIDHVRAYSGKASLEDVCAFLNKMSEPLEITDDSDEESA